MVDATQVGNRSFARDDLTVELGGSEDCLFLNVYCWSVCIGQTNIPGGSLIEFYTATKSKFKTSSCNGIHSWWWLYFWFQQTWNIWS